MTKYLLDTNVVLRLVNPSDLQHEIVTEAIATLLNREDECYLTAPLLTIIHEYFVDRRQIVKDRNILFISLIAALIILRYIRVSINCSGKVYV